MTLRIQRDHRPKARLDPVSTLGVLREVWNIGHDQSKERLVDNAGFWHQVAREHQGGARFGISPPGGLNELTWGDVVGIARGLLDYFGRCEQHEAEIWTVTSFHVYDTHRGGLASGVLTQALPGDSTSRAGDDGGDMATA